jgi:hypothetical protein
MKHVNDLSHDDDDRKNRRPLRIDHGHILISKRSTMRFSARGFAFAASFTVYLTACSLVIVAAAKKVLDKGADDSCNAAAAAAPETVTDQDDDSRTLNPSPQVPLDCQAVMATSTIPDAGWGVFSLIDMQRGMPFLTGDLVIQITDLNELHADGIKLMLHDYLWGSDETGAFYEGKLVVSAMAGVGMLANGMPDNQHNALPFVPTVDEGGLTRMESPGAGASTHYHNLTFFMSKPVTAGSEIYVNYRENWFEERKQRLVPTEHAPAMGRGQQHDVAWLRQHGRCLDNIVMGRSRVPHAGRGAFATRDLDAGAIVSPIPALVIPKRQALDLVRKRKDGTVVQTKQLLLNYCLGHTNSSVLLYPYGPMVNLVNHAPPTRANVRLQWSKSEELHRRGKELLAKPLEDIKSYNRSGLLLELVATRDISKGQEIFLDYGVDWQKAWVDHVQNWKPTKDADTYTPSYVMEDVVKTLRLESELAEHPYPENVFTSCFYRYSDQKEQAEKNTGADAEVTTFRWNMTRGLFELRNLRPCKILQRQQDPKQGTLFTVRIMNRYGLTPNERLPKGAMHIVTHVARRAVRFSDKIYTTDQHLENAFRHEIGIPDDIFPQQWMGH